MRIMAMGTKFITRRLISVLAESDFELVCPYEAPGILAEF